MSLFVRLNNSIICVQFYLNMLVMSFIQLFCVCGCVCVFCQSDGTGVHQHVTVIVERNLWSADSRYQIQRNKDKVLVNIRWSCVMLFFGLVDMDVVYSMKDRTVHNHSPGGQYSERLIQRSDTVDPPCHLVVICPLNQQQYTLLAPPWTNENILLWAFLSKSPQPVALPSTIHKWST